MTAPEPARLDAVASASKTEGLPSSARPAPTESLQSVQDFVRRAFQIAVLLLAASGYELAWSAKLQPVAEAVLVAGPRGGSETGAAALSQLLDQVAGAAGAGDARKKRAEAA